MIDRTAGCAAALAASAHAAVVFEDNFDTENGGNGQFDYTTLRNWTITDGSIDLFGNGFFDFAPGNGLYLDMDGITDNAGRIESDPIPVQRGRYRLTFDILGQNTVGGFEDNRMTVEVGGAILGDVDISDTGRNAYRVFLEPGDTSIAFDHDGGDLRGLLLDNVRFELIPAPAAALALFAMAWLAPRRRG